MPASLAFLARRFDTAEPIRVTIAGRNVAAVEPAAVPDADGLPFVSPGFFDIPVNGWGGVWFGRSGTTPNDVRRVVLGFPAHGVPSSATTRDVVKSTAREVILVGFGQLGVDTSSARAWMEAHAA